jgi:hypothetical protein
MAVTANTRSRYTTVLFIEIDYSHCGILLSAFYPTFNVSDLWKLTIQTLLGTECANSFDNKNCIFCARILYGYYNKQTFIDRSFSQKPTLWCESNMLV